MKYTTALAFVLACGPAAILAAPVAQGATSALTSRQEGAAPAGQSAQGPAQGSAQGPAQGATGGSASQGLSGQSSGNEGILGYVEEIVKEVLGSVSLFICFTRDLANQPLATQAWHYRGGGTSR